MKEVKFEVYRYGYEDKEKFTGTFINIDEDIEGPDIPICEKFCKFNKICKISPIIKDNINLLEWCGDLGTGKMDIAGEFNIIPTKETLLELYRDNPEFQKVIENVSEGKDPGIPIPIETEEDLSDSQLLETEVGVEKIYLHEDTKLRVGGRKAQKLTKDEFEKILDNLFYNKLQKDPDFLYDTGYYDDEIDHDPWTYVIRPDTIDWFFPKLKKDILNKIGSEDSDNIDDSEGEIIVTPNKKIPCIKFCIPDPDVIAFIYWDGKTLRGYVPTKGNLWRTDTHRQLNSFWPDDDGDIKELEYIKKHTKTDLSQYTGEDGYWKVYDKLEVNLDWCLEDFESRLEIV